MDPSQTSFAYFGFKCRWHLSLIIHDRPLLRALHTTSPFIFPAGGWSGKGVAKALTVTVTIPKSSDGDSDPSLTSYQCPPLANLWCCPQNQPPWALSRVEGERESISVQTENREHLVPRGGFKKLRLCSVKDLVQDRPFTE